MMLLFNSKVTDPEQVIAGAWKGVKEFWGPNGWEETKEEEGRVRSNLVPWTAPAEGFLKANCDGSFNQEADKAAIGIICRRSNGEFLWGFGEKVQVQLAFLSEVLAEGCDWKCSSVLHEVLEALASHEGFSITLTPRKVIVQQIRLLWLPERRYAQLAG